MILLTGATGYIGGRLLKALEERGDPLRCFGRNARFLRSRVAPATEIAEGDALSPSAVFHALAGVETAYYLIHSMGSGDAFAEKDRQAATIFAAAASAQGVKRIIYLGGLGGGDALSGHLESRQEVGKILRDSGVETLEFRASIIIGSGSLSFEMIRALVDKLPVMIAPRWVGAKAQPIAIEDVIGYLLLARDLPPRGSTIFEIGGSDQASYAAIMHEYASQRGLKRTIVPVPVLTPRLSGLWLGLVTPLYARVGRKLIDSLRNETTVSDDLALRVFPIRPRSLGDAIRRALANEDREVAATRWSDAISSRGGTKTPDEAHFGSRLVDCRSVQVSKTPADCFWVIQQVGGPAGWFYGDWLWRLRGSIDLLAGGPGMRRGRRHPREVSCGDAIDFWRVEAFEPGQLLRLVAEMKLPGRAWLQFEVAGEGAETKITQTAIFDPKGLLGLAYWYVLYPIHCVLFAGILRSLKNRIIEQSSAQSLKSTVESPVNR